MKRMVSFAVALLLVILFLPLVVHAMNHPVAVYVNGGELKTVSPPIVVEHEAYIQAEDLAAVIGSSVSWNGEKNRVTLANSDVELTVTAGSDEALLDGKPFPMGSVPIAANGSLMIPLEELGRPLGFKAVWDALTQSVFIYKQGSANPKEWIEDKSKEMGEILMPGKKPDSLQPERPASIEGNRVAIFHGAGAEVVHFYLNEPPCRIVADVPADAFGSGLRDDAGSISGEISAGGNGIVKNVRWSPLDERTVRFVIELSRQADYSVSSQPYGTLIHVHAPDQVFRIVIDPGHGGKDPGATGYSGRHEKYFTLELSQNIYNRMKKEPGLEPYLTRTDDSFVDLEDRAAFANDLDADLFISVHGNTFTSAISGTETYYYSGQSLAFGEMMHKHVAEATGLEDRGLRKLPFKVLQHAEMPAVLLELGYLSTQSDEQLMLSREFQDRVAEAVIAAVKEYLMLE